MPIYPALESVLDAYLDSRATRFPATTLPGPPLASPSTTAGAPSLTARFQYLIERLYVRAGIRAHVPAGVLVHALRQGRSCDADTVVSVIERLVAERGAPEHLRTDNGPELVAWALRDWCRLAGTTTTYIEPGSPGENPFIESFNGRVRDELLEHRGVRQSPRGPSPGRGVAHRVQDLPAHSSLGGLTPTEYAERWTINQPALP